MWVARTIRIDWPISIAPFKYPFPELDSSPPSAAYMRQWTWSSLVQVILLSPARHQAITWPNSDLLSTGPLGTNLNEILIKCACIKFTNFHSVKCAWKCRLWNGGHLSRGRWVTQTVVNMIQCHPWWLQIMYPTLNKFLEFIKFELAACQERTCIKRASIQSPWTFRLNIGLNTSPSDSFVSYLNSHLGYSAGEFQALQLIVLAVFGAVD